MVAFRSISNNKTTVVGTRNGTGEIIPPTEKSKPAAQATTDGDNNNNSTETKPKARDAFVAEETEKSAESAVKAVVSTHSTLQS